MRLLAIVAAAFCASAAACTDASSPVDSTCAVPAPLMGSPGPRGVGYIVQLHDQVDVLDETARLSHVYNIEPIFVSTFVPYFHATFDDNVRDRLRCEPSVKSIEYDSSGTPPPASPAR